MNDDVTEWLRWQIANLLLFQRVSSNLTVVGKFLLLCKCISLSSFLRFSWQVIYFSIVYRFNRLVHAVLVRAGVPCALDHFFLVYGNRVIVK